MRVRQDSMRNLILCNLIVLMFLQIQNRRLYIDDFAEKTNDYSNLKRDIRDVVEEVMNN